MDHNETRCSDEFNGDCHYAIVVVNNNNKSLGYELTISHSQNNHIQLQEGTPYIDSVDLNRFKYYKFSILDSDIQNVSISLTPMHGDSDLYVSRSTLFPNKTTFEKRGMRASNAPDHVEYS